MPDTFPVEVTHEFQASIESVFDAWLNPDTVGSWLFATPDGVMEKVMVDARVGGGFQIDERRGDAVVSHVGEYLTIERPHRLVFQFTTNIIDIQTRVTVIVTPISDGCRLTLTHDLLAEWAEFKTQAREGWTSVLKGLAEHLVA